MMRMKRRTERDIKMGRSPSVMGISRPSLSHLTIISTSLPVPQSYQFIISLFLPLSFSVHSFISLSILLYVSYYLSVIQVSLSTYLKNHHPISSFFTIHLSIISPQLSRKYFSSSPHLYPSISSFYLTIIYLFPGSSPWSPTSSPHCRRVLSPSSSSSCDLYLLISYHPSVISVSLSIISSFPALSSSISLLSTIAVSFSIHLFSPSHHHILSSMFFPWSSTSSPHCCRFLSPPISSSSHLQLFISYHPSAIAVSLSIISSFPALSSSVSPLSTIAVSFSIHLFISPSPSLHPQSSQSISPSSILLLHTHLLPYLIFLLIAVSLSLSISPSVSISISLQLSVHRLPISSFFSAHLSIISSLLSPSFSLCPSLHHFPFLSQILHNLPISSFISMHLSFHISVTGLFGTVTLALVRRPNCLFALSSACTKSLWEFIVCQLALAKRHRTLQMTRETCLSHFPA